MCTFLQYLANNPLILTVFSIISIPANYQVKLEYICIYIFSKTSLATKLFFFFLSVVNQ